MAVSPDGARLYVVDTARDVLAVMDTEELTSESFELDLPSGDTPTEAAVSEDGTLFVAAGTEIASIDPTTREITATWATGAPVTALGTLPDGLGVAMADRKAFLGSLQRGFLSSTRPSASSSSAQPYTLPVWSGSLRLGSRRSMRRPGSWCPAGRGQARGRGIESHCVRRASSGWGSMRVCTPHSSTRFL